MPIVTPSHSDRESGEIQPVVEEGDSLGGYSQDIY